MSDRRPSRSPPAAMPIFRIVSVLVMLTVIGMTIYNLHERSRRGEVASGGTQYVEAEGDARGTEEVVGGTSSEGEGSRRQLPPSPAVAKKRTPAPEENAEQWKMFARRSEAIVDRATSIRGYEMPAYWQVLGWVDEQSLADLQARKLPQLPFKDYLQHPSKLRGRAIRVALEIRQVTKFDVKDPQGKLVTLYELWGVPTELDGWLYVVVTPELPSGFPMGKNLGIVTTAYGYFFKVQGYQPFDAKPNARPLYAPMIIGRVGPVSMAAPPAPASPFSWVVLVGGSAMLIVIIAGWIVAARRKTNSRPASEFGLPEAIDDATGDADWPTGVKDD